MLYKIIDRILFHIYFKFRYQRIFKHYGDNIRWGKHFSKKIIPSSVRISCPEKIEIGDNCCIDEGVYLQCHYSGDGISIKNGCRINAHSHLLAYSHILLEEKVLIAPFALISSGNHGYHEDRAIMDQPHSPGGDIVIGAGSWIGQGGKVLGGVTLAKQTVVGAGAVVTESFSKDKGILLGIPAREVK